MARIVVVLPAPFGPRNPTTWPDGTREAQLVEGRHRAEPTAQAVEFEQSGHGCSLRVFLVVTQVDQHGGGTLLVEGSPDVDDGTGPRH